MSKLSACMSKAGLSPEEMEELRHHAADMGDETKGAHRYLGGLHDDLESLRTQLTSQGHDVAVRRYDPPKQPPKAVVEAVDNSRTAERDARVSQANLRREKAAAEKQAADDAIERVRAAAGGRAPDAPAETGLKTAAQPKPAPVPSETFHVPVSDRAAKALGIDKSKPVSADYEALQRKHPETFSTAEDVKDHVEHVLENPTYVGDSLSPAHKVLVRPNGGDHLVAIRVEARGDQYNVRSAYDMAEGKLQEHLRVGKLKPIDEENAGARSPPPGGLDRTTPPEGDARSPGSSDASHEASQPAEENIAPKEPENKAAEPVAEPEKPPPGESGNSDSGANVSDIESKWAERGVKSSLSESADTITLSKVIVPEAERGKGVGTEFMTDLTQHADGAGKKIATTPSTDFGGTSVPRLVRFYRRFGFVPNKGPSRDFSTKETMVREPQAKPRFKPSEKGSISLFDAPPPEEPKPPPEMSDVRGNAKKPEASKHTPEEEQRIDRSTLGIPSRIAKRFSDLIENKAPGLIDLAENAKMMLNPMAAGSDTARATAKDFANALRLSRYEWGRVDKLIQDRFNPEQRKRMWEAADEQSVLEQQGKKTKGKGLDKLNPEERAAVEGLQRTAQKTYDLAKKAGMIEGEGIPSYVPRMVVDMSTGKAVKNKAGESSSSLDQIGKNLRTSTSQLLNRKHLTVEETEAAAQAKFGDNVGVVRDIRTLAMATAKLQDAIAGRTLINKIREIGRQGGEPTVSEGSIPSPTTHKWFTINNPSMTTWRPKMQTVDGKTTPIKDANNQMVFEKVPLYIRGDFEGPLRAVLSTEDGKVYRGLMDLKARTMSVIMYSPLIHNGVEWGRALGAIPGKVATFKIYFEGNAVKKDPVQMREAIDAGLVPIGARYGFQDISSIVEEPNIAPGRSWTAQILSALPGLVDERAGMWTKRAVDQLGDVWHNKLLWDRVADLQMGLYSNFRDNLVKKGTDRATATKLAAHLANRYAGALPIESMSSGARKLANIALFSRSFTLGNLGAMKDAVTGIPSDIKAQIMRDGGSLATEAAKSYVRRKSQAVMAIDIALNYLGTAAFSSGIAILLGRTSASDEAFGYLKRLQALTQRGKENPLSLLNPMDDMLSLMPQSENEPGKENRVYVGRAADGSGIYMRLPFGKIGEEFEGWLTKPIDQLKAKLSTFARPALETATNDKGFGRHVYDPYDKAPGSTVKAIGNIVMNFMGEQLPVQAVETVKDLIKGEGDQDVNLAKTAGPFAGITFSKGAPGGPEMGEYYAAKEEHDTKVQMAMPDIRKKIKAGDRAGAIEQMTGLGIPPHTQASYMRSTLHPKQAPTPQQLANVRRYAPPEQQERLQRAAQKQRDIVASR